MTHSLLPIHLLIPLIIIISTTVTIPSPAIAAGGQWQLLQNNIGIVAMHMQLLHNDRVIIFDRTDFGFSNLSLPNGRCRVNPQEQAVKNDCTAHSLEYDVFSNTFRPLFIQTNIWCSSGSVNPNGTLIQTGGFNDGDRSVRTFNPCPNCDWQEFNASLSARRWYATNHKLPDGRQIIIGGRRQFNYEFYPKKDATAKNTYSLPFLVQTNDASAENNLYPFVFLNVDGNLFIFANNRAILFDYNSNKVIKTYPTIPGGDPRSYPSSGSAVLLPLRNLQKPLVEAEVMICGGAPKGSYEKTLQGSFIGALNTCGRLKITDPNPSWVMETMPGGRVMSDMILLPNGDVLLINGAAVGSAGWESGRNPVLNPFLYKPNSLVGSRFQLQKPSDIPRMYHSTAVLLRDGRVLVAGSNPHVNYNFTRLFPTELRLEAFSPSYLELGFNDVRPIMVFPAPQSQTKLKYAQKLKVRFQVKATLMKNMVSVTMYAEQQQQQKELEEVIKSLPSDVVNDLLSLGLCVRCIFRVFRVESSSVYAFTSLSPTYDDNNKLCTLCLGILQFRFHDDNNNNTNVPLLISDMVKRQGYHSHHDSFSLEIIIPSIILNNDNTLRQYIKIKYGFKDNTTFISAKDAFNFSLLPPLQTLLGVRCNSNQQDASFHIRLTYTASKDDNNNNNKRRKTDEHNTTFTTSLQDQSSHCCKFLLETANQPCHFTYSCYRTPLYFGGRYLKYSRNVSQSRWIIDDERMGEASVEEIIGENILQACQADSFKFHAAGREDIDVRMLGPGRPFLVEVKNARQVPSELSVKDIEKKINTTENKLVRVKNMKLVGSQGWDLMREGEAEKQKQYAALVWISRPLKDEDLQHVTSLKDLKVMQKTPIRVLHRRSPLEREKIIHWMKLETIAGSSQYFLLHLCTQAGTYIKEFVHGDLGRTHPSIGSMLGCRAEILQLDVTDIKMECFLT